MRTFVVCNGFERAIQFLMEPSGHYLDMPAGAEFLVRVAPGENVKIHHQDPDVMVEGGLSSVSHNGEVLASWEPASDKAEALQTLSRPEELRKHMLARGERIFAQPDGLTVFRDLAGKSWACRVRWSDEEQAIYITGAPGIEAPAEREAALAVALCRINAETALPGFRLWPATEARPTLGIAYTVVLMLDDEHRVASSVVERALSVCFGTVVLYAARLEAIAAGATDPGAP